MFFMTMVSDSVVKVCPTAAPTGMASAIFKRISSFFVWVLLAGDFEEMTLEEMAMCHCRCPDATAPAAAKTAMNARPLPQLSSRGGSGASNRTAIGGEDSVDSIGDSKEAKNGKTGDSEDGGVPLSYVSFSSLGLATSQSAQPIGFALVPVTLTPEQILKARHRAMNSRSRSKSSQKQSARGDGLTSDEGAGEGDAGRRRISSSFYNMTVEESVNRMLWEETYRRHTDLRDAVKSAVEESASRSETRDLFDQTAEIQTTNRCIEANQLPSVPHTDFLGSTMEERIGRAEISAAKVAAAAVTEARLPETVVERLSLYGVAAILGERERPFESGEQQLVDGSGGGGGISCDAVREVQVRWCRSDSASEITWERKDMVVLFQDYLDAAVAIIKAALNDGTSNKMYPESPHNDQSITFTSSSSDHNMAESNLVTLELPSTTAWQKLSLLVKQYPQEVAAVGDCRSSSALPAFTQSCISSAPSPSHSSGNLGLEFVAVDLRSSLYGHSPPPRPHSQQPVAPLTSAATMAAVLAAGGGGAVVGNSSIVSAGLLFNTTVLTVRVGSAAEAAGFVPGDIICDMNNVVVRPVASLGAVVDVFTSLGWPLSQATFQCTVLRPPVFIKDYYLPLLRQRRGGQEMHTSRSSGTNQTRRGTVDTSYNGSGDDADC